MARQVERVDRARLGQGVVIEQPVVQIAAEAVDQQHVLRTLPLDQVADARAVDLDALGRGAAILVVVLGGHEIGLEIGDEGVDLGVGDGRVGDNAEQPGDRQDIALRGDAPAQHAARGRFRRAGDFLGLDIDQLGAGRDRRALVDQPAGDLALLHGETPFRHCDDLDALAHLPYPATSRTAAPICSALGM